MSVTAAAKVTPGRRSLIAKIHVAKKQLALEDDSYRALLRRITGVDSSAAATDRQLEAVIGEFKRLGWKDQRPASSGRSADGREQASKLRALWRSLYQLGYVDRADDDALTAWVTRTTGKQAMRWNSPADLNRTIEAAKAWCLRVGYDPKPCDMPGARLEGYFEPGLIQAQWDRLEQLGAFTKRGGFARLDSWMGYMGFGAVCNPWEITPERAVKAVAELGSWIRRQRRKNGDGAA